eukprot:20900-Heterococcus_DN1.PRE.1
MAAEAPRHGAFDPGGQKIQQDEVEDEKLQQEVNVCALCFSSRCDCRASVWAHFDGKLGRTTSHVVVAVRIDVFVLQAQQVGSVNLQHEEHDMVTAVCCLPCKLGVHHNVVTATTTGIVRPTHSIHIWRLSESVAPRDRQGNISCNALALNQSRKASCTFAEKHQNAITSICAVPAAVVSLTHAAFVTCSKGSDTPSDDHGTIRLWTKGGAAVSMKLHEDDSITKLPCEASVAKVIITVDQNGDTLIAAYFAARSTGIELWNITTGLKRKWDHTEGQYLATVTPENEIRIWREQRNGGFKQYAQIAGTTQSTIMTIQFDTAAMSTSARDKRASSSDTSTHKHSNLLVDISGYLECVVSAARGGTLIRVIVMKHSVQLFKEHPAVAFQPFTTRGNTLIEYALTSRSDNSKQLLCLLDPDAAVLG